MTEIQKKYFVLGTFEVRPTILAMLGNEQAIELWAQRNLSHIQRGSILRISRATITTITNIETTRGNPEEFQDLEIL